MAGQLADHRGQACARQLGKAVEAGWQEFVCSSAGAKLAVVNGQTLVRSDAPLPGAEAAVYNGSGLGYFRMADGLVCSWAAYAP